MTDPSTNPAADALLVARLAALTPPEYDRVRKAEAKAAGILVTTLDDLVRKARTTESRTANQSSVNAGAATDPVAGLIAEFNARFMMVNEAGKAVIYAPAQDLILHRRFFERMELSDFRALFMNRQVIVGRGRDGNPTTRPVADVWLHHPDRRQFIDGIVFDPSGPPTSAGTLNLWQGFAVEPRPGSWALMRTHIRDVICSRAMDQFEYLIRWNARMI